MCVPVLVPGLGCALRIPTTSHTVLEEQALASERPDLTFLSGGSAFGPGAPPILPPRYESGTTPHLYRPLDGGPLLATVPTGLPPQVQLMIQAANDITSYPYCYGGGHDSPNYWPTVGVSGMGFDSCTPGPTVGYDCSGAVEWVLHKGIGYDNGGAVSSQIVFPDPNGPGNGPGQYVTIESNGGHVRMQIAGLDFESTGQQHRVGPTWYTTAGPMPDGPYKTSHPPGL
jgi:hypothetical protein